MSDFAPFEAIDHDGYDVYALPFAEWKGDPPRSGPCRKFHITADYDSAAGVLEIVLPFLRERNIHHKAVLSVGMLKRLDEGKSSGKFITVYQEVNRPPQEITDELGALLRAGRERGLRPSGFIPRSRPHGHQFAEAPHWQSGGFVWGGMIVDRSA